MRRKTKNAEEGFALVAVMVVMVLLLGAAAALHSGTMADTSLRGAHQVATAGFYAAEAGVNRGMGTYRDIFMSYRVPSGSDFNVNTFTLGPRTVTYQLTPVVAHQGVTVTVPGGRQFAGLSATEYQYTAVANSQLHSGDTEVNLGTQFNVDYIPLFQFLAFFNGDLELTPAPAMQLHGPMHANGNMYMNDSSATLQILDCGAGYAAPNYCPGTIPKVQISMVGNLYRGRSDSSTCTGTVTIAKLTDTNHDGVLDTQNLACSGSGTTQVSAATISSYLGAIQTRHARISVPGPEQFSYNSADSASYWQHADLRLVLDMNNRDSNKLYAIYVANSAGAVDNAATAKLDAFMNAKPGRIFYNDIPKTTTAGAYSSNLATATCASGTHCNHDNYDFPFASDAAVYPCWQGDLWARVCTNGDITNATLTNGTLVPSGNKTARRGGFWNNREQAWVGMLNVNLHDLLWWNRNAAGANQLFDPADISDGGPVIFLTVVGPGSNAIPTGYNPKRRYGVRVFGSSDLDFPAGMADPTGVMVVSDQAIYVEGNYNVGTVVHPKMPAAFIGDTINVLSAGWSTTANKRNDYQARIALTTASRPAADTTIWAAFLGGVDLTNGSDYSGGFENYPRFHEAWDAGGTLAPTATLTYRGSFVSLGIPLHNDGRWPSNGNAFNMYNPPIRAWDFDTDFMNPALLPPMTPRAVTTEQILFTENFR